MNFEMEEGEILDDLDDLSDISSEEENLLRQRLEVLENYNNVLERKNAKRSYNETGFKCPIFQGTTHRNVKQYNKRANNKHKRFAFSPNNVCKEKLQVAFTTFTPVQKKKIKKKNVEAGDVKQKQLFDTINVKTTNHKLRNKLQKNMNILISKTNNVESKSTSDSSDEASNDFKDKKSMLANAVTIQNYKLDKVSLKSRLIKMFPNCTDKLKNIPDQNQSNKKASFLNNENSITKQNKHNYIANDVFLDNSVDHEIPCKIVEVNENTTEIHKENLSENVDKSPCNKIDIDSDEDLDLLRQCALKSKADKPEHKTTVNVQSEDEDSDTKELRLICLKSALLKNAIEVKRKERIKKRLSQSTILDTDLLMESDIKNTENIENNSTDIESVDMDTDSDSNDKEKHCTFSENISESNFLTNLTDHVNINGLNINAKNVDAEEDEDLLRAKLLTSLSKKLPKLTTDDVSPVKVRKSTKVNKKNEIPVTDSNLVINPNDSDSGSETEAAKNLRKMHNKLVPSDFQKQLDLFLKSTRMEVEKKLSQNETNLPVEETTPKPKEKFVAKALTALPKPVQIEYNMLVKRMAELEKLKKARLQYSNNLRNTFSSDSDTIKQRNISIENLENNIALSRKKIAEESARILKLKEEGLKLMQKHKIVATELRNLTTAIALNKKQTRIAQIKLTNSRNQHQVLLKRSRNSTVLNKQKLIPTTQTENTFKPNSVSSIDLKKVKVSIVNEIRPESNNTHNFDIIKNQKTLVIDKGENSSSEMVLQDAVKASCQTHNVNNSNIEKKIQEGIDDAISILNSCTNEKNPQTEIHIIVHQNSMPSHEDSKNQDNLASDYDSPLQSITSDAFLPTAGCFANNV